jgi:hypothetical protein
MSSAGLGLFEPVTRFAALRVGLMCRLAGAVDPRVAGTPRRLLASLPRGANGAPSGGVGLP